LEAFERAWQSWSPGTPAPRWEDFLPPLGQPENLELGFFLVQLDIAFRVKAGQAALLAEPYFQHPRLQAADVRQVELIRWEYQLRWQHGDRVARQDYLDRFPQHAAALHDLKPRWSCPRCDQKSILLEDETTATAVCPRCQAPSPVDELFTASPKLTEATAVAEPSGLDLRNYELLDRLGQGGMGEVYRSRDPGLGRDLAIKVLRPELRGHRDIEQRFELEARIAGSLQHPGIVPVYNLGRLADGRLYFTMKVVRGQTLAAMLREPGERTAERRAALLGVFEKVCQALAYAHSRGVIHRDLEPANVMVGAFGEVQVMDWGLAKVLPASREQQAAGLDDPSSIGTVRTWTPGLSSQAGAVMGTPAYMAPEQARGEVDRLDQRCDVFGLGAMLCVILTGQSPYGASSGEDLFHKAVHGELSAAYARLDGCGADAELVALAKRCLAAQPEDRPADASTVVQEIKAYQDRLEQRVQRDRDERVAAEARAEAERQRAEAERRARRRGWRPRGWRWLGCWRGQ
jgi:serine/threonine protein kinase